MKRLIMVRGAGEIGTGVAHTLHKAGYRVLLLDTANPVATRRLVAFSEAIFHREHTMTVERDTVTYTDNYREAERMLKNEKMVILVDPTAESVKYFKPKVFIDAVVDYTSHGTNRKMADFTIGMGPGFCAGRDVDVAIETVRGYNLGRLVYSGFASRDTNNNGVVGDTSVDKLVYAQADGVFHGKKSLALMVNAGDEIGDITKEDGEVVPVTAPIEGVLRGRLHSDVPVKKGQKIADIHPNIDQQTCFMMSDKSRFLGASVLLAVTSWEKDN